MRERARAARVLSRPCSFTPQCGRIKFKSAADSLNGSATLEELPQKGTGSTPEYLYGTHALKGCPVFRGLLPPAGSAPLAMTQQTQAADSLPLELQAAEQSQRERRWPATAFPGSE